MIRSTMLLSLGLSLHLLLLLEGRNNMISASSPVYEWSQAALAVPDVYVVETIPVLEFDLDLVSKSTTRYTHEALLDLVQATRKSLDICAMYWNLLGVEERKIYSKEEMEQMGASRGQALYEAIENAAKRGVHIRIVTTDTEFGGKSVTPFPYEIQQLVDQFPNQVAVQGWNAKDWYGGGIMHQKLWISDRHAFYLGSANNDWKSIAQVMELGIVVQNQPKLVDDMLRLFEAWWTWTSGTIPVSVDTYFSTKFQTTFQVPLWSSYLQKSSINPFAGQEYSALGNIERPVILSEPSLNAYIAAAPHEVLSTGRSDDIDSLLYTIQSAKTSVSLSVMDYQPSSKYPLQGETSPIWWPDLNDAITSIVFSRGVHVRMLISRWQHTGRAMLVALKKLQDTVRLCEELRPKCAGRLEIRLFEVPGWNNTVVSPSNPHPKFPTFSRVNHGKFIVSDHRVNVGTSNMIWDYFHSTAGISLNTNHPDVVKTVQSIFDRNWNSSYAIPLTTE